MPPVRRLPRAVLLLVLLALLPAGPAATAAAVKAAPGTTVTADPGSGPAGSTTAVAGRGFAARASGTVTLGTASVAVRTDDQGAFRTSVTVPSSVAGSAPVTARVSHRTASSSFHVVAPSRPRLRFGVATPGGPTATAELDAVTAIAGEAPALVLSYADFTRELDLRGLEAVVARGAVPMVTWEPWVAGAGVQQPAYALDRIAAGDFDPYVRRWADGLRAFGRPVMLRFAHEMNGDWYPWSEGVNGNGPGDYVAAWRHVRSVFAAAGASNVSWTWSPNVPYAGSVPLTGLYPGAGSVDVLALDGYNSGTSQPRSGWVQPEALFGPGLQQLRTLAPGLPIVIAETASAEAGGSKADWVRALFAHLAAQPDVTAVVWFHLLKETDWRLDSSAASAAAVREALRARDVTG